MQITPELVGIAVTGGFLVLGVLSKALASSKFTWDDLHLGVEASLTAVSGAGVYGFDLLKQAETAAPGTPAFAVLYKAQQMNYAWLFVSLIVLFATATMHMSWGKAVTMPIRRFLWLQAANVFGLAILFGFIYFVKHGV